MTDCKQWEVVHARQGIDDLIRDISPTDVELTLQQCLELAEKAKRAAFGIDGRAERIKAMVDYISAEKQRMAEAK